MADKYIWKEVKSDSLLMSNIIYTKVCGGWLVALRQTGTLTFIPDPDHKNEPLPA